MSAPHPESRWTHPICGDCYSLAEPGRFPTRVAEAEPEDCCFCGDPTESGIYYRADPMLVHP